MAWRRPVPTLSPCNEEDFSPLVDRCFTPDAVKALQSAGWTVIDVPAGVTLHALREQGAPFRSDRYFREFAPEVTETPTVAHTVAYRPELLPNSLNRAYDECAALLRDLSATLPPGLAATIAPAAVYAWLLMQHHRATGAFPLAGHYTWTSDRYRATHLALGVFGRDRPLLVAPIPELRGRGIGVLPVVVAFASDGYSDTELAQQRGNE